MIFELFNFGEGSLGPLEICHFGGLLKPEDQLLEDLQKLNVLRQNGF